jgi:pyochelin biosynthesis protein PchG
VTAAKPMRALVCGTNFGRFYIEAVRAHPDYALAGLLARGSAASRACARRLGVPLYTAVDQLPDGGIDVACVVVGSTISGGAGTELATGLLGRGIHVLQEHPVHLEELTASVRLARRQGVQYRLNTHYPYVAPVAAFTAAARRLTARRTPLFVDAATPVHLMHPLVDILGRALGGLRPWRFAEPAPVPEGFGPQPFRTVQGVLGGVPLTLRVHHEMDPADRDNHALHWHRVSVGTDAGVLTLADTHGPVLWSPRLHARRDADHRFVLDGPGTGHLDTPTTAVVGSPGTFREVFATLWPQAIGRVLDELRDAIAEHRDPLRASQYDLTACRVWSDLAAVLGPPRVVRPPAPALLSARELFPGLDERAAPPARPEAPQSGAAPQAAEAGTPAAYTPSAEFFDLVAQAHAATASGPAVARALAGTDTSHGPVLDIGAGTGLVTAAIARVLPDAEIWAVEPASGMRGVLTSRVFGDPDLRRRVTVTADSAPDLDVPDRISAAVLCGVLGHLDAGQRKRLWKLLRERLHPGGRVVVELMGIERPIALPATRMAIAHAGQHRYEWWLSGTPDPDEEAAMRLHSVYRVFADADGAGAGAGPLREVHDSYLWFPFGIERVAEESGLRLRPLTARTGGPPLAVLTHELTA